MDVLDASLRSAEPEDAPLAWDAGAAESVQSLVRAPLPAGRISELAPTTETRLLAGSGG